MRLTPEREAKIRRFSVQWGAATEDMLIDLLDEIDAMREELAESKRAREDLRVALHKQNMRVEELAAVSKTETTAHVVLPRAEVEEWIVGLRSYNDDVMFDYMPGALRELLGD
jgi:hypothetical protein